MIVKIGSSCALAPSKERRTTAKRRENAKFCKIFKNTPAASHKKIHQLVIFHYVYAFSMVKSSFLVKIYDVVNFWRMAAGEKFAKSQNLTDPWRPQLAKVLQVEGSNQISRFFLDFSRFVWGFQDFKDFSGFPDCFKFL